MIILCDGRYNQQCWDFYPHPKISINFLKTDKNNLWDIKTFFEYKAEVFRFNPGPLNNSILPKKWVAESIYRGDPEWRTAPRKFKSHLPLELFKFP